MQTITAKQLKHLIEHWGIPIEGALANRRGGEIIDIETGLVVAEWVPATEATREVQIGFQSVFEKMETH